MHKSGVFFASVYIVWFGIVTVALTSLIGVTKLHLTKAFAHLHHLQNVLVGFSCLKQSSNRILIVNGCIIIHPKVAKAHLPFLFPSFEDE